MFVGLLPRAAGPLRLAPGAFGFPNSDKGAIRMPWSESSCLGESH